jgi:hypothetical protein
MHATCHLHYLRQGRTDKAAIGYWLQESGYNVKFLLTYGIGLHGLYADDKPFSLWLTIHHRLINGLSRNRPVIIHRCIVFVLLIACSNVPTLSIWTPHAGLLCALLRRAWSCGEKDSLCRSGPLRPIHTKRAVIRLSRFTCQFYFKFLSHCK